MGFCEAHTKMWNVFHNTVDGKDTIIAGEVYIDLCIHTPQQFIVGLDVHGVVAKWNKLLWLGCWVVCRGITFDRAPNQNMGCPIHRWLLIVRHFKNRLVRRLRLVKAPDDGVLGMNRRATI